VFGNPQNKWVTSIFVSAGANETSVPFGTHPVIKIFTLKDWWQKKIELDLASLILEEDIRYYTSCVSHSALKDDKFEDICLYVFGDPGDKPIRRL
jgi:hypothetical protein